MSHLEQYPGVPYYLLGGLFLGLSTGHLLYANETLATTGFRGLLPMLVAGGLVYAGYQFRALAATRRLVVHAGLILAVGAGFAATVAGYIVWLESSSLTVADLSYPLIAAGAGGALLATPITYYYVTAAQRMAELEAKYAEAEQMRKQLSILDRVLRHNLRNELNIIAGWADEPSRNDDDAPDSSPQRVVARHLARLEDLSETARRIRQVFETDIPMRHDVTRVVESVVTDVGAQAPAVTITTDLPATAHVLAHPQVDTALRELLENAIEHNDNATLTVEVAVTPAAERADGTRMCCIEIRDTGRGIPRLEIEALTQPEETPLSHGRGLGLRLVYAIVEQSGGHLEVVNAEQGTAVRLWLPRAQPPAARTEASTTAPPAGEPGS